MVQPLPRMGQIQSSNPLGELGLVETETRRKLGI